MASRQCACANRPNVRMHCPTLTYHNANTCTPGGVHVRGLIYQAQDGYGHAVAHDGSQRDAAWYGMGGGDAITGVGAMSRSTSPPFWGGIRDGAVLRLHVAAARLRRKTMFCVPYGLCHHHCFPFSVRPCRFAYAASAGVCVRCGRGGVRAERPLPVRGR